MQKITVKNVSGPITKPKKDGSGDFTKYTVEDTTGAKYDTFDSNITVAKPGSVLDIEIRARGKYMDIASWSLINSAPAPSPESRPHQLGRSCEDRTSIERQVCLKCACEIHGGNDDISSIIHNADMMHGWLSGEKSKPIQLEVKTPTEKAWEATASTEKQPENLTELLTWVAGHGKEYTKTWLFSNFSCTEAEVKADSKRLHNLHLEVKQAKNW